jgi:hypothetical protein
MSLNAKEATPAELGMQRRLFGIHASDVVPVTREAMWHTLRALRKAPELERFNLFLVGSRLEASDESLDIDVVLAPRRGCAFSDARIERALFYCREYGLRGADPSCVIDPSFRREGPSLRAAPLWPDQILQTAKLLSPKLAQLGREGRIADYRRFGRFSVEYRRRASETSFFEKLPQQRFDGAVCRYLRPAIEVTCDVD